jgi:twinkle protein
MANLITDDDIDFAAYEAETDARQQVRSARIYVQELIDTVRSPRREVRHYLPWGKTRNLIQFRPGEVTVWGGENGSGKSLVTGQVMLSLAQQGQRVCIASFEMKPRKTLARMGRQWTHFDCEDPHMLSDSAELDRLIGLYEQFRDWSDDKLWLYDRQGTVGWRQVIAVARYCAKELGIKHFVVDNLMKCVAGEDDYNGQKAFVDELTAIARDNDMHIHLVVHVKKPDAAGKKPNRYDIKGSGSISDQPDNVILVWRDKAKEKDRKANKPVSETLCDVRLIVDKQRNGTGWEGEIGLWFDEPSHQYLAGPDSPLQEFWAQVAERDAQPRFMAGGDDEEWERTHPFAPTSRAPAHAFGGRA